MIHLSRSKKVCSKEGNPDYYQIGFYIIRLSHFEELRQMIFLIQLQKIKNICRFSINDNLL